MKIIRGGEVKFTFDNEGEIRETDIRYFHFDTGGKSLYPELHRDMLRLFMNALRREITRVEKTLG